ncbi:MAG: molybdopterin-dependent oxidoreductase [Magnetococcales bacterium]|nr:molybdopterin-dependent oxidoreductase [Magnetococcales bacterium]
MTEQHHTTCPLDCPGACALSVEIEQGSLKRVAGNHEHPFTQGVICGKVARFNEIQNGERVAHPMVRTGAKGEGVFKRISWDEALDRVAARFRNVMDQEGSEAILPYRYGGTMGIVQQKAIDRLTHRAGFSRMDETLCYTLGFSGWQAGVGAAIGPCSSEMSESELIVLWGIDAVATHINLMPFIKKARKKGARLVVIDPRRTRTAELADLHLQPRPGTDGALAVAIMCHLLNTNLEDRNYLVKLTDFDDQMEEHLLSRTPEWASPITGIPSKQIKEFATLYGSVKRSFLRVGLGMSRQRNGSVNVHAVSCLPAMTGAWKEQGGGALFATGDAFSINQEPVHRSQWMTTPTRRLDMSRLGPLLTDEQLDPPIRALWISNSNPAVSCPDLGRVHRGLRREDLFTVVHEIVFSETTRFADILLPATTFLEHDDLYKSFGQYTVQKGARLLSPFAEARCNSDVVNDLAKRMGYDDAPFSADASQLVNDVIRASDLPAPSQWEHNWIEITPDFAEAHFLNGFPTQDGRFHFYPAWSHAVMPDKPDHWPVTEGDQPELARKYPLDFMIPPVLESHNSTFTSSESTRKRLGPPQLSIHPQDAARRTISSGDTVRVFNDRGVLTMPAVLTEDVQPGVCSCPFGHGGWGFEEGIGANLLVDAPTPYPKGGALFHDNRVQVEKA